MINSLCKYYLNRLAVLFLPVIFFCSACNNDPEEIRALTGNNYRQEDKAQDVTFIYSKDGVIKMRAFAHDFLRNESADPPYIDMNRGLKAEFFDSSGQVEHVLTADSSRYYVAKGDVIVWDSVKIVSKKGQMLTTSELIWNAGIQKFFTEKPVRIATKNEVLYGNGMEANSDFTWYQILNPKGTVEVPKGELPK